MAKEKREKRKKKKIKKQETNRAYSFRSRARSVPPLSWLWQ